MNEELKFNNILYNDDKIEITPLLFVDKKSKKLRSYIFQLNKLLFNTDIYNEMDSKNNIKFKIIYNPSENNEQILNSNPNLITSNTNNSSNGNITTTLSEESKQKSKVNSIEDSITKRANIFFNTPKKHNTLDINIFKEEQDSSNNNSDSLQEKIKSTKNSEHTKKAQFNESKISHIPSFEKSATRTQRIKSFHQKAAPNIIMSTINPYENKPTTLFSQKNQSSEKKHILRKTDNEGEEQEKKVTLTSSKSSKNLKANILKSKSFNYDEDEFNLKTVANFSDVKDIMNIYEDIDNYELMQSNKIDMNINKNDFDTFSFCIFTAGLNCDKMELINSSQNFPAMCGHKECALLNSFKPSVLEIYKKKNCSVNMDISNLTAMMTFPLGIKLCFFGDDMGPNSKNNKKILGTYESFCNILRNEIGDSFYMITAFYYIKMSVDEYNKKYNINPLKEFTKFQQLDESTNNDLNIGLIKLDEVNNAKSNSPNKLKGHRRSQSQQKKVDEVLSIVSKLIDKETLLIPQSISIISRYPYIQEMKDALDILLKIKYNEDSELFANTINHLLNEVPSIHVENEFIFNYLPYKYTPNTIYSTNYIKNILLHYDFSYIFTIPTDNIISLYNMILCEQKVLFVDDNFKNLSDICLFFIFLLYPLKWDYPIVFILTLSTVPFLQSIIPFIMGIDEYLLDYAINNQYIDNNSSIIIYNIKKGTFYNSSLGVNNSKSKSSIFKEFTIPEFPSNIRDNLEKGIKNIKKKIKEKSNVNMSKAEINKLLKKLFIRTNIMLFGDYKNNIKYVNDIPTFDKDKFLDKKQKNERNFYDEIISTQTFTQFLYAEKLLSRRTSSSNIITNTNCSTFLTNDQGNENISQSMLNSSNELDYKRDQMEMSYFRRKLQQFEDEILLKEMTKERNSRQIVRSKSSSRILSYINKSSKNIMKHSLNNDSLKECNDIDNANILDKDGLPGLDEASVAKRGKSKKTVRHGTDMNILDTIVNNINVNKTGIDNNKKNYCPKIDKKIKKYYLISPFFIKESLIKNNKKSIEDYIKRKFDNNIGEPYIFNIPINFNGIPDEYLYYSRAKKRKRNNSIENKHIKFNINSQIIIYKDEEKQRSEEENKKMIDKWISKIISNNINDDVREYDLKYLLKDKIYINYLSIMLSKDLTLNEKMEKLICDGSFDELLSVLKIVFTNFEAINDNIKEDKLIEMFNTAINYTISIISYYKLDELKNKKYIYESMNINLPNLLSYWNNEKFWICLIEDNLNKNCVDNDDSDSSSDLDENSSISYVKFCLSIMKKLKIKNEIIEDIGRKLIDRFLEKEEKDDIKQFLEEL